jgi:hypothetical protein
MRQQISLWSRHCVWLLVAVTVSACGTHDVAVEFYFANGYHFSQSERRAVQSTADTTTSEVRRLLPTLPDDLLLRVYAGKNVIPETGETATSIPPNVVIWTVDPSRIGGVTATVRTQLRATLFHELHHLVRYANVPSDSLMDDVITEGMATVFERDFAGASPPWGVYPDNVMDWVIEILALPVDANRAYWLTKVHPDGRRWIGMRAGAFLVDRAVRATGRSAADLVSTPTKNVMDMGTEGNNSR